MISDRRIKISIFFWRHCAFLPVFSFRTPCWSWRGWHYSDQLLAVWVALMGVVLGASIQGDPHLLTVSQSSPLCSLSIWPCHRGTGWQIGMGRRQRRGRVGGISFRKQALLNLSQNKIKDSCQMLYWAHRSRARKWHYQWWSQRFVAAGELKLSFISIRSPRRLCLFNWQSSLLSITPRNTAGRQLGGNIRTNEQPFSGYFTRRVLRRFHLARGWVRNREQCVYLIPRWLLVVWCGWPQSICVWVCVRLHLCACVVLGANDSWHLATISGSLISIERFGGGFGWGGVQGHRFPSISQTDACLIC